MAIEIADLVPVDPADERERLIRHICESIRVYTPAQRIEAFFDMKRRLAKTSIEVLRQIIDEDVVNATARSVRTGATPSCLAMQELHGEQGFYE
jgi:predicted xylose isomerase-like sugar epimerase